MTQLLQGGSQANFLCDSVDFENHALLLDVDAVHFDASGFEVERVFLAPAESFIIDDREAGGAGAEPPW